MDRTVRHELAVRSGSVAFAALFAVGPLAVLIVMLISSFDLDLKNELAIEVNRLFGDSAGKFILQIINQPFHGEGRYSSVGWWSGLFLLISAGAIFGQIRRTLRTIFTPYAELWESKGSWLDEVIAFIKFKFFSILLVVVFIFMSAASLLVSSVVSRLFFGGDLFWGGFLDDLLSLLSFGLIFSPIIYFSARSSGSSRMGWSTSWIGGFFTSFMFTVGKRGISLYLAQSPLNSIYGTAGSLAAFLIWIYYSSLILFLGAELSAVLSKEKKRIATVDL